MRMNKSTILNSRVIIGSFILGALVSSTVHQFASKPKLIATQCRAISDSHNYTSDANEALYRKLSARYTKVPEPILREAIEYAGVYAKPDFPKQQDLLAVIAVESSFNPKAKSQLKSDPAIGLTQIRPKAWGYKLYKVDLATIENQIKYGSEILTHNYKRVNDKSLALHAYNLGLTSILKGKRSKTYVVKYERELNYIMNA